MRKHRSASGIAAFNSMIYAAGKSFEDEKIDLIN
jgi:hypothetical protein